MKKPLVSLLHWFLTLWDTVALVTKHQNAQMASLGSRRAKMKEVTHMFYRELRPKSPGKLTLNFLCPWGLVEGLQEALWYVSYTNGDTGYLSESSASLGNTSPYPRAPSFMV